MKKRTHEGPYLIANLETGKRDDTIIVGQDGVLSYVKQVEFSLDMGPDIEVTTIEELSEALVVLEDDGRGNRKSARVDPSMYKMCRNTGKKTDKGESIYEGDEIGYEKEYYGDPIGTYITGNIHTPNA